MHVVGISVDNRPTVWALANGDGFQSSSSSASDDDYDDEYLLKKLCMLLCMPQSALECTSEHQNFLGEHAPDPPSAYDNHSFLYCLLLIFIFSTQPMMQKVMYSPDMKANCIIAACG